MAHFFDTKRAAGAGKEGSFSISWRDTALSLPPFHNKAAASSVTKSRLAPWFREARRRYHAHHRHSSRVRLHSPLFPASQRMSSCGVARLDNDKAESAILPVQSCRPPAFRCHAFTEQPAGCGHRKRFGGITKGARVAGELVSLEAGDGIVKIIAKVVAFAGTLGDQPKIIAMKEQGADGSRNGCKKCICLPRRDHQEPVWEKKR